MSSAAATPASWAQGEGGSASSSAPSPEKHAKVYDAPASLPAPSARDPGTPPPSRKLRSCVTCRKRKVKCDKTSPCSNCRRAEIPCVVPSLDKRPRWARRLRQTATHPEADGEGADQVFNRLKNLEGLVKQLSGQLEQTNAARGASSELKDCRDDSEGAEAGSSPLTTAVSNTQNQYGRMVIGDAGRSRYIDSGFWSRINDELNNLKIDTEALAGDDFDSSEDEDLLSKGTPSSTQELGRDPVERNGFMFPHNLPRHQVDLATFHPLPSQLPYILNIFHERINSMSQVVHMPTLNNMIRDLPTGDFSALSLNNQALLFAMYYASIASMEEQDVIVSFGSPKCDLTQKYRQGFEHALARTDFLNSPDIVLVQALAIFLLLARRHDSPRYVWMMTGLLIRMGLALGLHRDGDHFPHFTPFEVEERRRLWWGLVVMDLRSSEDQGMDLTIIDGSFDTKLPLNINDEDIHPHTKDTPKERDGITDMTVPRTWYSQCIGMRQIYSMLTSRGEHQSLEKQKHLLDELASSVERNYLQYSDPTENIRYWMFVAVTRLVVSKMTLFIYLPELFSSPTQHLSDEIRAKLLIAAIEVAEFNHTLNSSEACRPWRWIFQTYTHWHSIVYLLLTAAQQPWSPAVERGWIALQSKWLIPPQPNKNMDQSTWLPLRKLMAKARRHREAELRRLRRDPEAVHRLEAVDRKLPQPISSGPFHGEIEQVAEIFRQNWRQVIDLGNENANLSARSDERAKNISGFGPPLNTPASSVLLPQDQFESVAVPKASSISSSEHSTSGAAGMNSGAAQSFSAPQFGKVASLDVGGLVNTSMGPDLSSWQWSDSQMANFTTDFDMGGLDFDIGLDGDMDWNKWLQNVQE
ncbi:hypothetical protein QQS21_006368 [Conoideocrella luteorostrata]|uniref:Zn(2)-C6 fungal-type domain-containing protein n=1 Tax=Conoideocrella luteorostrata TaxID=1105319 RepID=A0AAJ0CNQ6_9HYPO|nr:hypothetical protein QQS21_006368 [Conoideocrella luteorostrata]